MLLCQQFAVLALLICGLRCLHTQAIRAENDLELLFSGRTPLDWQNVWHHESHSRCRHKLIRHLYWACEKDIYRITRRSAKRNSNENSSNSSSNNNNSNCNVNNNANDEQFHKAYKFNSSPTWLRAHQAYVLLRTRRRAHYANSKADAATAPTITSECCTKNGCTWEEYAEYCPSNKRRTHY